MEKVTGWKVKREIEKWEKKQVEELKVKQVDKLIQTVKLVPIKVCTVGVQSDIVVPAAPVVIKGPLRATYASIAIQALMEVAALAPVGPVPPLAGARALVVHEVSGRQL